MAQTFDTSRVGGGTYELEQDANGNYKLKSVGFAQVNKLNLPDLATSDITTTTPKKEEEKKIEVADPFLKLGTQNTGGGEGGGGQDYSGVMLKTPEVKEATVKDASEPMTKIDTGKTDSKFLASAAAGGASLQGDKASDPFLTSDAAGGTRLPFQTTDSTYKSPTMAMKEQEFAQGKYTPKATGLQKVKSKASDALKKISNLSPIRMAGNVLGAVVSSVLPEESPTQKLNKSYFNVRGGSTDSQRIAGNPATDLYAGMNRNSDFGNLERAGNKRIETREATAKRKGYTKDGKGADFIAKTEKMKADASKYKAAKQKATQGPAGSEGGGDKGSDSGRVICTDLHRTKELSTRDWIRDTKFTFKTLSIKHVKGYLLWAEPTVRHIQKYPRYRKIWKHIAQHRANDIAWRLNEGKFDLLGRIYAGIGEPVCWALGNFVSDKQISKYNLTHWRRA